MGIALRFAAGSMVDGAIALTRMSAFTTSSASATRARGDRGLAGCTGHHAPPAIERGTGRDIGDDAPAGAGRTHGVHRIPVLPGPAVNAMRPTGAGGRIVNVATRPALEWRAGAGMVAYTASKAAVAALTVALAEEVVKADILVNAIAPSTMDTAANRKAMPKADFSAWTKVEDVAATILFLASPENKVTRGGIVPVYGRS